MVIVCDDEDRENEGDLTMAAQFATARDGQLHGRGRPRPHLPRADAAALWRARPAADDQPQRGAPADRVHGLRRVARGRDHGHLRGRPCAHHPGRHRPRVPSRRPRAARPRVPADGPAGRRARALRADRGGRRPGQAGRPQPVRRHLRDHERRRHDGPRAGPRSPFARKHGLKIVTVADLIKYRRRNEHLVRRAATVSMPTKYGDFKAIGYESVLDGSHHVALVKGDVAGKKDVLVRVHSECLTGDTFGSLRCDCGDQLAEAMRRIEAEGLGRGPLHAPGGPRHRPHQQAQGLRAPGAGLRHGGGQRGARLRGRTCATTASARRSSPTSASRPSAS